VLTISWAKGNSPPTCVPKKRGARRIKSGRVKKKNSVESRRTGAGRGECNSSLEDLGKREKGDLLHFGKRRLAATWRKNADSRSAQSEEIDRRELFSRQKGSFGEGGKGDRWRPITLSL